MRSHPPLPANGIQRAPQSGEGSSGSDSFEGEQQEEEEEVPEDDDGASDEEDNEDAQFANSMSDNSASDPALDFGQFPDFEPPTFENNF